ncbi:MAG: hypothetical protein JWN15_671, partial [Firmicutes bacterium]|nr:hypothetical protein [Bacillota bacterium]
MDFRQLNIKLTPGVDDDIAERLER